jgi:O-antigen/teichoic acid export membrane protein
VGRPDIILWAVLGKLVLVVALLVPLTPRYGLVGASTAVTVPMLLEQLYLWRILGRQIDATQRSIADQLLRPSLSAGIVLAMLAVLRSLVPPLDVLALSLHVVVAAITAVLAAFWLDRPFFRRLLTA